MILSLKIVMIYFTMLFVPLFSSVNIKWDRIDDTIIWSTIGISLGGTSTRWIVDFGIEGERQC